MRSARDLVGCGQHAQRFELARFLRHTQPTTAPAPLLSRPALSRLLLVQHAFPPLPVPVPQKLGPSAFPRSPSKSDVATEGYSTQSNDDQSPNVAATQTRENEFKCSPLAKDTSGQGNPKSERFKNMPSRPAGTSAGTRTRTIQMPSHPPSTPGRGPETRRFQCPSQMPPGRGDGRRRTRIGRFKICPSLFRPGNSGDGPEPERFKMPFSFVRSVGSGPTRGIRRPPRTANQHPWACRQPVTTEQRRIGAAEHQHLTELQNSQPTPSHAAAAGPPRFSRDPILGTRPAHTVNAKPLPREILKPPPAE